MAPEDAQLTAIQDDVESADVQRVDRTEAQFTIRSLFVAMAVVALLAALVGPIVRRLSADKQARLLTAWGIWLAACVIWTGYQAKKRQDAERLAGPVLLCLPMFDEKVATMSASRRWFNIVAAGLMALVMLIPTSIMVLESPSGRVSTSIVPLAMTAVWSVVWSSRIVAMLWWRKNIRFCGDGILWDQQVLLWDYLVAARWNDINKGILEVKGIDQNNVERSWKIPVPAERHDDIQAILNRSIVRHPSLPVGSLAYELGRIPLSEAVRHPQLLRYISAAAFGIVSFFIAIYFIHNGVTGFAEFDQSIIVGFFLSAFSSGWHLHLISKKSGRPIVRLSGWLGWRRILPIALAAAGFYYLGITVSWSMPWFAYVAGTGFGFTIGRVLHSGLGLLDLRENGVLLHRSLYWPWETVRLIKWNAASNGRLVLGRDWRRVVATVPREQRDAVSSLLNEKLAIAKEAGSTEEKLRRE